VRKDNGIYGVFGVANRIILGNLNETLGNVSVCPNFTISFLFKFIYPLPQGEAIRVFKTNPERQLRSNSNPVDINFFQIAENVSLHAVVGKHGDITDGARVDNMPTMDHWTHATVVYREPDELETEIYLNGSRVSADLYERKLSAELPDAQPYEYTIGDDQVSASLSVSWFQFFKGALSAEQVQNVSDDTISRGTSVPTFLRETTIFLRRGRKRAQGLLFGIIQSVSYLTIRLRARDFYRAILKSRANNLIVSV